MDENHAKNQSVITGKDRVVLKQNQQSTTTIPRVMRKNFSFNILTDRERAMSLTFFYPEYEGLKTSPQAYVREAIKRQQYLNELCRRNIAQAQIWQRKKMR